MNEENGVRFLLGDKSEAAGFVYRPPNAGPPIAQNATLGVKLLKGFVSSIHGTSWVELSGVAFYSG